MTPLLSFCFIVLLPCLFPGPSPRAFRGKHVALLVRFPNQARQLEDLDIWSHTNDTVGAVRRYIATRTKAGSGSGGGHAKVELYVGGEPVDPADDRKLIGQLNIKDKTVSNMTNYSTMTVSFVV